ncbi:hypothetical protein CTA2_6891 [Colletotrichum tanaceti]|uniref:Uncharacterized protein n=1 Tax=Colletotrichum tanaceti TaxID=1306861 RepID=A0A4U6XKW4_9PEZI|nr:hypothetical protein CTA2_6891 [Colletotrichum tanaceti]TKW56259.1 hypothetical protein CTA1_11924 [Colletotrichum tanaceti]
MSPSLIKLFLAATSATAVLALTPVEDLANKVHVPVSLMVDVLNAPDYTKIDIGEWAGLLKQPVEAVRAWPEDVKAYVLAEISTEVSLAIAPKDESRELVAVKAEPRELVARAETVRRIERQLLSVHNARVQSGRSKCFQNIPCGACVIAAGFAGTAGIAGCVGAAFTAIGGTAGTATPIVISALIECGAKAAGVTSAAIGACHTAL